MSRPRMLLMAVRLVNDEELTGPLTGYRLLERLGRGGFGEVWKVEAPGGLLKAMKFVFGDLDSADEDGKPAEQELKALHRVKSIRHPYILSLERFDIVDGHLIIVMELADRNLWDRFRECRSQGLPGIPRDELLRYLEEAAEALDLMNDQYQIQHLDVKPQNLFLVHNHVKVADFGLAKLFEGDRGTVTGGVTPVYAAPETFEGWVSRYTDQYSLAIVYQELLTGVRPFAGANTKQLLLQHLSGTPDLSPLPEADRPLVARALNKKPEDRWHSSGQMMAALRQAGGGPVMGSASAQVATPAPRTKTDTPRPSGNSEPMGSGRRSPTPHPSPGRAGSGVHPPPAAPRPLAFGPGLFANTPLNLITPRLVTPQGGMGPMAAPAPNQTIQRAQVFETGRMSSLGIAPPERSGDGVLFPAIVVAVGQTGLDVVRTLRELMRFRFGSADGLPVVRFLYIDTDPDAALAATQGPDALPARDVVLARLNRPAHYLQQSSLLSAESWLPSGALYRLPKNPGPAAGVRAFGRLALCDHYRVIAQRIRQEIEPFLIDDPLDKAAADTGLGVRSNRCRAYVIAGTSGGSGSGMLVDLAYVIKHELRGVGYRKPETVGVLLVPPADKASARSPGLANTYAALSEVYHYTAGSARYAARFDPSDTPILDAEGPFTRCTIVPLPRVPKNPPRAHALNLAARGLFAEMFTSSGRVTDYARSVTPIPGKAVAPIAQVSGSYRLSWPRAELLGTAIRRFIQRLLQRWAAKETSHLREPIQMWLTEQWARQRLDPESLVDRFEEAARAVLHEEPFAVFDAAADALRTRTPGGRLEAAVACDVFDQILTLVGRPVGEGESPGTLESAIQSARKTIAAEAESNLATVAVSFIEQPQYRLAGAEEALNQIADRVKHAVAMLDQQRGELAVETKQAYSRVLQLIAGLQAGQRRPVNEIFNAMREYPLRRLQLAEFDAALMLYRSLLNNMPDYLRDVNHCRARLAELGKTALGTPAAAPDTAGEALVLPTGCATLDDTADQFLSALPPEDILVFDQAIQRRITKKFRGVVSVCLKSDKVAGFLAVLSAEARTFLDVRLDRSDPATVLLRYLGDGDETRELLNAAYIKAAPPVMPCGAPPRESAVLSAPAGDAGDWVRRLASASCPGAEFIPAIVPDDIVFHREFPRVELGDLPQMMGPAREAYEAQLAADNTPHTRTDIVWTTPGS